MGWPRFLPGGPFGQTLRRRHGDPGAHRGQVGGPGTRGERRPGPGAPRAPAGPAGLLRHPPRGARGWGGARGRGRRSPGRLPPRRRRSDGAGLAAGLAAPGRLPRARLAPTSTGAPAPPAAPSERGAPGPGAGAAPAGGGGSRGARRGGGACGARGAIMVKNKGGRGGGRARRPRSTSARALNLNLYLTLCPEGGAGSPSEPWTARQGRHRRRRGGAPCAKSCAPRLPGAARFWGPPRPPAEPGRARGREVCAPSPRARRDSRHVAPAAAAAAIQPLIER